MEQENQIIQQIKEQGILPLFYHANQQLCINIAQTLYNSGVRIIEFTNRGEAAFDNFKAMLQARDESMPGLLLAVGTIRTGEQATKYIDAGADFLISPVFDEDVSDIAYINKKLWIPGCMTPTEIHVAENAGCKLIKLFPGNVLGPSFMSAIKELFPKVSFMPTGGVEVTRESIGEWLSSGVVGVGLGSKLITKKILETGDMKSLESETKRALQIIKDIRA